MFYFHSVSLLDGDEFRRILQFVRMLFRCDFGGDVVSCHRMFKIVAGREKHAEMA